ncbi:hypothetical protein JZ751_003192 [Albula glossodonta]|uniref:Uncharacterized protein n=1 Tax=Albula glossodonta TaxID=121402 RepID=A0A8T2NA74_9TELE|nr:hypothetical protein JZ751_003192 [Albula glossodonta]
MSAAPASGCAPITLKVALIWNSEDDSITGLTQRSDRVQVILRAPGQIEGWDMDCLMLASDHDSMARSWWFGMTLNPSPTTLQRDTLSQMYFELRQGEFYCGKKWKKPDRGMRSVPFQSNNPLRRAASEPLLALWCEKPISFVTLPASLRCHCYCIRAWSLPGSLWQCYIETKLQACAATLQTSGAPQGRKAPLHNAEPWRPGLRFPISLTKQKIAL